MNATSDLESYELSPEYEGGEFEGGEFEEEVLAEELGLGEYEAAAPRPAASPAVRQRVQQLRQANARLLTAIRAMSPHVRVQGGAMRLAVPARTATEAAARLRIDPRTFQVLHQSLRRRSAQLQAGRAREYELDMEAGACQGVTSYTRHWWGHRLRLNSCDTKRLLDAMRIGAGLAAVCGAVVPQPHINVVCKILGALGGLGAAAITAIDNLGGNRGIVISQTWASFVPPFTIPPVVWHQ